MKTVETIIENAERKDFNDAAQSCRHFAPFPSAAEQGLPEFDTPECEAKFRRALRNIPSKTFIGNTGEKVILYVRPDNLLQLGASVNRLGLENCRATRKILRYLDNNKAEFLKFEHPARN